LNVLICPGSFKGSLSAIRASEIIAENIPSSFNIKILPLADGGDSTLDILHYSLGGKFIEVNSLSPFKKPIKAKFLLLDSKTAVVEMAQATGLKIVDKNNNPALFGSSCGTGLIIKEALKYDINTIYICFGGSATVDGAKGMLDILGVEFLSKNNNKVIDNAKGLKFISKININKINKKLEKINKIYLCDVTNPILGENGGIKIFSPQKGASPKDIIEIEKGFENYIKKIKNIKNIDINSLKHSGAAGGSPASLKAFFGGKLTSGSSFILNLLDFNKYVEKADIIITGEGKIDNTTNCGKIVFSIFENLKNKNKIIIAFTGNLSKSYNNIYSFSIIPYPMNIEFAMKHADKFLANQVKTLFKLIKNFNL